MISIIDLLQHDFDAGPLMLDLEKTATKLVGQLLLCDLVYIFCVSSLARPCRVRAADFGGQAQVIPGGSEEFNAFIRQNLHTQRPDVFLGILQSAFILGEAL